MLARSYCTYLGIKAQYEEIRVSISNEIIIAEIRETAKAENHSFEEQGGGRRRKVCR